MASKKASSGPNPIAKVFAMAAQTNQWDAAKAALIKAIEACASGADAEKLFRTPGVCEGFLGEADAWPEVADAIVARANAVDDPKEGARIASWAARGCAFLPIALVRPDREAALRKPGFSAAVDKHLATFRAWLASSSPEKRAAGAHIIAWCKSAGASNTRALREQAGKEKNATALASEVLTLGVVARDDQASAKEAARAQLGNKNSLIALSAAAALALMGEPAESPLVEHVTKPVALPAEWGWHAAQPPAMKSDWLACAILTWAKLADPEGCVRALASKDLEKQPLGFVDMVGEALAHAAFDARGRPVPSIAAAAELDAVEREAVAAFGRGNLRRAGTALRKLGLPNGDDIPAFLAQEGIDWRPVAIAGKKWHFARIWSAVAFGEIPTQIAANALLAAFTPEEAVRLVTISTPARNPVYARMDKDEYWARDQELALAVIAGVRAKGFDMTPVYRNYASTYGALPGILAVAYLNERSSIAKEDVPLLAAGVAAARVTEPLRGLLAALLEADRCAILHTTPLGGHSLRVMDLCLDELTVSKLVAFGGGPWAAQYRTAVLEVLSKGNASTVEILRSLNNPAAAPLIQEAIASIR